MSNRPRRLQFIFQYYDPALFFLTFNTADRRRILANGAVFEGLLDVAEKGSKRAIAVGSFIIMPDHIHLFVSGGQNFVLSQWVRLLKRHLSKAITAALPHWQEGFFDHLIRHSESYAQKWEYVSSNPVRAGLVSNAEDWPWRGEPVLIPG